MGKMACVISTLNLVLSIIGSCFASYQLSGYPSTVVVGDTVTMVLNCIVDDDLKYIKWRQYNDSSDIALAEVKNNCTVIAGENFDTDNGYYYYCNIAMMEYTLNIIIDNLSAEQAIFKWRCTPLFGNASNIWGPTKVLVPVTNVEITPVGSNKTVGIKANDTLTFTCATNSGRPAAWIQWYIGEQNMTNQATSVITANATEFITSSTLNYTGKDADHNKVVYCDAINIGGRQKIKTDEITIFVLLSVTQVSITPVGINSVVSITEEDSLALTCTTDFSRPAAKIKWYIGGQNLTNQAKSVITADGDMFITSSTLNYTGKDADHNKTIYCEAANTDDSLKIQSTVLNWYIKVPVTHLTIAPIGNKNVVRITNEDTIPFSCTTDLGRPAAWIEWYIGGKNMTNEAASWITTNGSKFTSASTLNHTGRESDHDKDVFCEAVSVEGTEKVKSITKQIYIRYPVQSAFIMPVGDNNTISAVLEKLQIFTCTTGSSRPAAWIHWYIGGKNVTNQSTSMEFPDDTKFFSTSTLNYTLKDTDHNKVVYCEAINIERSKTAKSMKTLYVIVPISSVTIFPTFGNKSVSVTSEVDFNFTCRTSVSRPGARIYWYIGSQDVTNTALSIITQEGSKFISSSNLNYTGNIADHDKSIRCEAVNSHVHMVSQNESLYVRSRTTKDETYDLRTEVFIGTNEGLNLTVHLIANPKPDVTWTFDSNLQMNQTIVITEFNITSVDIFRHVTKYVKNSAVQSDFGNYTVKAGNGIDSYFVHVFAVKPAQAPSPPFNLDAVCDQQFPFINVSWLSNFNGGSKQNFFVVVRNMITNVMVNSSAQRDRGQNIIHSYETTFAYDSVYAIHVEAYNKHGGANSSDVVNCTTSKEIPQSSGSSLAVIGGAAGFGASLIVVAVIGLVVFIHRRKKYKGDETEHIHRLNGRSQEVGENEEDGLKDNPIYGTSGASVSAVEYHPVQKPAMGNISLTAESQDKIPKKKKACVYENADDLRIDEPNNIYGNENEDGKSTMVLPSNDRKTKQNKDGLIYADLAFAFSDSGKTFVIRGLENRTNYAMIDLTKRAEPFPPDSDDDDTINAG